MRAAEPRVLVPVYFRAPLGGLQSHVRAQAAAIQRAGWGCTVVCKPGPFADQLRSDRIDVIEDDFSDPLACATKALEHGVYDLVHAHPFAARQVGLEVAERSGIPFVLTVHGMYTDGLSAYGQGVELIFAVSPAIRDYLVKNAKVPPERVLVIPNGVDRSRFVPFNGSRLERIVALDEWLHGNIDPDERIVSFVCRLDEDKRFVLNVLFDCWREAARTRSFSWTWLLAGDGTLREEVHKEARCLNEAAGRERVRFCGWLEEDALARLYAAADITIAPGRSALDCMACARPVIAVGSKAYLGLMNQAGWLAGRYTNFGGLGRGCEDYCAGQLFRDLDAVIYDDALLGTLGQFCAETVAQEHDQNRVDESLLANYRMCLQHDVSHSLSPVPWSAETIPGLAFADPGSKDRLADHWSYGDMAGLQVGVEADGSIRLNFSQTSGDKFYLTNGSLDFQVAASACAGWPVRQGEHYLLRSNLRIITGQPEVKLWVIEFGAKSRNRQVIRVLEPGLVEVPFSTSQEAESIRLAVRFEGLGEVLLAPFDLLSYESTGLRDRRRRLDAVEYAKFQGQHLVFVIGPPRSGTTWVLKLLAEHPDIVAASVDNLGVRTKEAQTLETNVFNPDRGLTDAQIRAKFHRLSLANPGMAIVEKTPIHLLHLDRLMRVFPKAAIILLERDGRDVVTSLVHVGRQTQAWWKGAPDTVFDAVRLWRQYARSGIRAKALFEPLVVRYEQLQVNPKEVIGAVVEQLGLTVAYVGQQVLACEGGRNIEIPGVFRQGRSGGWRSFLSSQDVELFIQEAGRELVELGYEKDDAWR